jgi:hypothetical protein
MPNDTYRLEVIGALAGQYVENVAFFTSDETGAADPIINAIRVREIFRTQIAPKYADCLPDNYKMRVLRCKRSNNGGGPNVPLSITALNGTRPGAAAISSVGPCIIFPYKDGGHWRQGRMFLPGFAEGDVLNNEFSAALTAKLELFASALLAPYALGGHNFIFAIMSAGSGVVRLPTGSIVSLKPAQQNGRLKPVL